MIVKNESAILNRCFSAVLPFIDEYCIVDTGSTDGTKSFIQSFFDERHIPGTIVDEPFRNFGHNRTHALASAFQHRPSCDYLLLIDADMVFQSPLSPDAFRSMLVGGDAFHIFQGTAAHYYKNVRIVRNANLSYWGVTHEYIQIPNTWKLQGLPRETAFILDVGDGGAKADKFQRDIRLLSEGLRENPGNDRYTFYLANSYRDAGELDNAIAMYKTRVELGGWPEEVWQSYYQIGKCYQSKGDMPTAFYWWLEGYVVYPHRIENLYEIVHHYRNISNRARLAYLYLSVAYDILRAEPHDDHLFLHKDVYDYKLLMELTILGYYYNPRGFRMPKVCMAVLNCPLTPESDRANVWTNYKFYAPNVSKINVSKMNDGGYKNWDEWLGEFAGVGQTIPEVRRRVESGDLVPSTPSICIVDSAGLGAGTGAGTGTKLLVCRRFVNYRIDSAGNYINKDVIETVNVCALFEVKTPLMQPIFIKEWILPHHEQWDGKYKGIEDVRLMPGADGHILWTGVRGLNDKMAVAYGRFSIDDLTQWTEHTAVSPKNVEKNWVYVPTGQGMSGQENKVVYQWFPKQIGVIAADGAFSLTEPEENMPLCFRNVRGSTPGVRPLGRPGETWFLVHTVSYESRRFYYHMWVVLDERLQLKYYSAPFTFQGSPVEYTLGFAFLSELEVLIGYSVNDCATHYVVRDVNQIVDECEDMQTPQLC